MKTKHRIECPNCKQWNQIEVQEAALQAESPEPNVKVFLSSYIVEETQKCEKCRAVLAEPNELFRVINGEVVRYRMKNI
jgi:phage FluMu protein Com